MNRKCEFIEKVYDLLVAKAGANPKDKDHFVSYHVEDKDGGGVRHWEWRFCGVFGFGGKYRAHSNRITNYREDDTPERDALRDQLNKELDALKDEYSDVVF